MKAFLFSSKSNDHPPLDKRPCEIPPPLWCVFTIDSPVLPATSIVSHIPVSDRTFLLPKQWGFHSPHLNTLDIVLSWEFFTLAFQGTVSRAIQTNYTTVLPLRVHALNLHGHVSPSFSWSIFLWLQLLPPNATSSLNLPLDLHTCVSNCPFKKTTWMSYRHLKCNMLKAELVIFSLSWYLFSSLSCWLSQLSNQPCKLGILFDSSHSFIPQIKPTD